MKFKIVWKGFLLRIFILICITGLVFGGFVLYKIYRLQNNIFEFAPTKAADSNETLGFLETAKNLLTRNNASLKNDNGRTNILLLGMGGEGHKGRYLTDTIMVVSIENKTYRSAMLSIPRDLYVKIPDSKGIHTKINAVYTYEIRNKNRSTGESLSSIKKVVEEITNQPIHYYLTLDFDGFEKIITEIDGIDLEVKQDIYDSKYPGPNYSYETFELKKGFQHLNATNALKYARVRHIKGGDFGRAARQQQVIAAAKKKAFSLGTIANPIKINALINTLEQHIKTDIQVSEIPAFINLAKNINIYQTTSKVLDAWSSDSLLGSTHVEMGGVMAYVLIPRAKNYKQIHELSENLFELERIKRKQQEIEKEDAKIAVILENKKDYYKTKTVLRKLGYAIKINPSDENLPSCPNENTIIDISNDGKLFTLDDLTDKLGAEVKYSQSPPDEESRFDIIACLSRDTLAYFEMQDEKKEDVSEKAANQSILAADGKVLFKKSN